MTRPVARLRFDELAQRVGEILYFDWDPIGVSDAPEARDEYDSYVPQVVKLLFEGAKYEAIASYLRSIQGENMGLSITPASDANDLRIAEKLIVIREWLDHGRNPAPLLTFEFILERLEVIGGSAHERESGNETQDRMLG